MANVEAKVSLPEKVPNVNYNFDTDNMSKLKYFLKNLHLRFKSQTLENEIIKLSSKQLSERNDHLETELVKILEIQKECEKAKHMQIQFSNQAEFLKKELQKEKDIIRAWTNSDKITHEDLTDNHWKEGLGYNTKSYK